MKKTTLLLLLLLTFSFGFGQTTLSAGDVAITGINSEILEDTDTGTPADTTDEFTFVLLTEIASGTVINFTDCGWQTTGNFRSLNPGTGAIAEGVVTWTWAGGSTLACGTEITITDTGGNTWDASLGTAVETDAGFDLRRNGDQLFAFQGSTVAPNFIFGVHFATNTGWTDATDVRFSAVPTGLTDGVNAFFRNRDNIVYKYNVTGNESSILEALVEPGEWLGSNTEFQTLGLPSGTSFTCGATTLLIGDIAVTGANSGIVNPRDPITNEIADDTDQFAFVLLTDIVAGTEINFTDSGWLAAGGFRILNFNNTSGNIIGEGFLKWTSSSDLPCGTEIIISDTGADTWSATLGTAIEADTGFNLQVNGDQILAFQGIVSNPSFLFGLHFANNAGWASDSTGSTTSALPIVLTEGVNALARNFDNIVYKYNVTGNTSLTLAALVDPGEWLASNSVFQTLGLPSGFSFTCDATVLGAGDIAITGANADGSDEFSFVLLTDIITGTEINFTDNGWLAAGGFRNYSFNNTLGSNTNGINGEGFIKWTATSDLSCGTEIIIIDTGSDTWSATSGGVIESETNFALSSGGDQIIAFQGTLVSPKFIFAFHFAHNTLEWTDAENANTSAVPAGLTDGINAAAFVLDNVVYNYSVTTNQSLILAATVDTSNWIGSNSTRQTLGIPVGSFSCATPGTCAGNAFWIAGAWSVSPDLSTAVFILDDYNTSTEGSFSACSVTIIAGAALTVENNTFIIVENNVTINDGSSLVVETQGSFVQNDDGGSMTILDSGTAILNKTTPEKQEWYYYTYWSSPVTVQTIGNMFPTVPSDWRYSFNAANFVDTNADDIDDDGNDWEIAADADTMIPGVGYAVAGERNSPGLYPREDIISFTGAFNTGNITVPITYGPGNLGMRWNFIGNPYPSAIDFVAFHLANASVVEGAAYFWSQASPPDSGNPGNDAQNLNLADYAVFTVGTGGAAGGSPIEPNGYIASGQGFFIPAQTSLTNPSGNSVTFTNAMRRADNTSNSQFFKGASSKQSKASAINPLENRLWLNLTTDNGVFNQILIGYVENATNDYDGMSYDAPKILNSELAAALYTSIENNDTKYAIQGKDINSITEDEIIKLGFINVKVNEDKPFKLSIAKFEGAFLSDNAIYIKDNVLGTIHNLSETDYTFTSESGEFNDRFEIVFKADVLSMDENTLENNLLRIIDLNNDALEFRTSENLTIKTVSVFDLLGRQLYDLKGNNSSETYRLSNLSNATYVVKVQLSNGAVITKKIIKK